MIPGVRVTATNEGTGLQSSTLTRADGSYIFTPLKLGTYTVAAQYAGLRKASHVHVVVNVQQQVVVNFTLQPGAVTQTVVVTTAVPLLQTQNASVGQVVGARTINDLPLNGRNFVFLAQLAAGVTFSQQDSRGEASNGRFVANGGAPTQLLGPGFHRLDFSLFKDFRTSESTRLEFRAEVFNLTNTPNFAIPSFTSFANPATFGEITSTRDNPNDSREIQLALKFYW